MFEATPDEVADIVSTSLYLEAVKITDSQLHITDHAFSEQVASMIEYVQSLHNASETQE